MVLGNGIAGQTCAEELRAQDPECSIVMIAAEPHPLYNRVALPRYLRGQVRREKVFMRSVEDYEAKGLEIHFSTWATEIANGPGSRNVADVTSVPSRTRDVSRASAARVSHASVGPGRPSPPIDR